MAAAIGSVLGSELKDRWFPAVRLASIDRLCLTAIMPPDESSRDQIWFDGSVKVRLVGYKDETVVALVEVIGPDGERPDAGFHPESDSLDLAQAEANDQSLLLYGELGFQARPGRLYRVATYLAHQLGHGSPNLDEVTLAVPIDRHGRSRLRHACAEGSGPAPSAP